MSRPININLSELDFKSFLKNGCILQKPLSSYCWVATDLVPHPEGLFFLYDFYKTQVQSYNCKFFAKTTAKELIQWVNDNFNDNKCQITQGVSDFDNYFQSDVAMMIESIANESIEKLVAVTMAEYEFNQIHPISKIQGFSDLNGSLYGMWQDGHGFLGVSPEPLFMKEEKNWKTRALAGTIGTDVKNYANIILNDQKELAEHNLVIEDICSKLSSKVEKIDLGPTLVSSFGPIAHLQTEILFDSDDCTELELVDLLSPTAALGGYPRDLVFHYLRQQNYFRIEQEKRLFGGVFGLRIPEEAFGLVAIRNIYWKEDKIFIHSGCGVVASSNVEKELKEIKMKRDSIERIFR
jgi:menaquinone-specific isochorismate synthase